MKVTVKRKDNAIPVAIHTEFIKLQDALKYANAAETGGMAKAVVSSILLSIDRSFIGINARYQGKTEPACRGRNANQ